VAEDKNMRVVPFECPEESLQYLSMLMRDKVIAVFARYNLLHPLGPFLDILLLLSLPLFPHIIEIASIDLF
jgi:hypothetical protein